MIESLKQKGHQRRICSVQTTAQSKPGLQRSGESGIKEIVLPWKALLLGGILRGSAAKKKEPSSFPLNLSYKYKKDNLLLRWPGRIGRLTADQSPLTQQLRDTFQQNQGFGSGCVCPTDTTMARAYTQAESVRGSRSIDHLARTSSPTNWLTSQASTPLAIAAVDTCDRDLR
jgi:hypothetical protein